jgi:hypothetical protein
VNYLDGIFFVYFNVFKVFLSIKAVLEINIEKSSNNQAPPSILINRTNKLKLAKGESHLMVIENYFD